MNKSLLILLVIAALGFISVFKLVNMRRQLPFIELVAFDKGVAVINSQKWSINNLNIDFYRDGFKKQSAAFDSKGIKIFSGLENGVEYSIDIYRTDLKGKLLYEKISSKVTPTEKGTDYYVLVGASVGKAWNIGQATTRLDLGEGIVLGNRTVYQFDKSKEIQELAEYSFPLSGVIIKECAAYFPRDLETSKQEIFNWVKMLRLNGKYPLLATVVPVTKEHDDAHPGRLQSILLYNDFIKDFAAKENIYVVDLEKAVRVSNLDRHLSNEWAQEDGLHLVQRAYDERLDPLILAITGGTIKE